MDEKCNEHDANYFENMEIIDTAMMEAVLDALSAYDPASFGPAQVLAALEKDRLSPSDFAALLSPSAEPFLEQMAQKAKGQTARHFGNSVGLFTPLYISNYCENHCTYCGFNCKNKINRAKLSPDEIKEELLAIRQTGLSEILLLTGESRKQSDIGYIGEAVKLAAQLFSTVGIEVYPMNSGEYAFLHQCGADFVSVYQETYDQARYKKVHPAGPKSVYAYRFCAQERALLGGMRGVAFGALLGLCDFRRDAFAAGLHAYLVQQKYPQAEISFSCPRLRPYKNHESSMCGVSERNLLQVMLAYRLFLPFAGITISTRERAGFRDGVIGLCATKISAGVKTGVGGHKEKEKEKGDAQFNISDPRSVDQVTAAITARGLQPVFSDYIYV